MTLTYRRWTFSGWLLLCIVAGQSMSNAYAADHFVPAQTTSVDCRTFGGGVKPGDTITIAGGTRGPLTIRNCTGTAQNKIVIRNDRSASGPAVLRRPTASPGGNVFTLANVEHIVVDGTAGWRNSSGHCGWLYGKPGKNCGIQITRTATGDTPTAFLKFSGLFRNYTVRGLYIDGRSWGSDDLGDGGAGIGIQQVSSETISAHPGYWRENILYEQNYIHNTRTECMYIGANWREPDPRIPSRNITIQDTYMHDCGRNAIALKSAIAGTNVIRRNYARRTGLQQRNSGTGGMFGYTSTHMALYQNIVIESGGQCFGSNSAHVPSMYRGGYFYAENNVGVRCGVISHPELGFGISVRESENAAKFESVRIDYNTIVDSEASGIRISVSTTNNAFARNNVITTPKSGSAISGVGSHQNNRVGSKSALRFVDTFRDDYQLSKDSPAIGAGKSPIVNLDLRGVPRPQGNLPDQGAYEFLAGLVDPPKSPDQVRVD